MNGISVVIADRKKPVQTSYLKRLHSEKGIRVVAEVGNKRQVVHALKLKPRILLLDWNLFALRGTPLLPLVKRLSPHTRVILMVTRVRPMRLLQALAKGARGYLRRALVPTSLVKAVRKVDGGEAWISRSLVPVLVELLGCFALP